MSTEARQYLLTGIIVDESVLKEGYEGDLWDYLDENNLNPRNQNPPPKYCVVDDDGDYFAGILYQKGDPDIGGHAPHVGAFRFPFLSTTEEMELRKWIERHFVADLENEDIRNFVITTWS